LLDAVLGGDAATGPLKRLLVERAEGNPFFLEESVRALVETGVLAGERGACRVVKEVTELHVPATVQAILAARVDRLAPACSAISRSMPAGSTLPRARAVTGKRWRSPSRATCVR
jgi:predicted ATPase